MFFDPMPGDVLALADPHVLVPGHVVKEAGRAGEHRELADLAAYLAADGSAYVNGEVVTIDGGEWLKGAAQFALMENLSEAEWEAMKPRKGG